MVWAIGILTFLSYFSGVRGILSGEYNPSIYTRVVWFGIAVNNFASVFALHNKPGIKVMATFGFVGQIIFLVLALKRSKRFFGRVEAISTVLLASSLIIWLVANSPLINLWIGVIAGVIGGIPTIKKAFDDPRDEHFFFWFWFFLASILALINADKSQLSGYLYPAYILGFDGLMSTLCLRRFLPKHH